MGSAPETEDGEAGFGVLGGEVASGGEEWWNGEGILHCRGEGDAGNCVAPVNEEVPGVAVKLLSRNGLTCIILFCSIANDTSLVY